MTRFLLIRHGAHDLLGRVLAGRAPGLSLSAQGRREAEELPERLSGCCIDAIFTSPMERARETAAPLATALGLTAQVNDAFNEVDFGAWTSRTFHELDTEPAWQHWNSARSRGHAPGGETMQAAQERFMRGLYEHASIAEDQTVAIFSHCDSIKAALLHVLGASLDNIHQFEISPASISIVHLDQHRAQVLRMNDTGPLGD